MGMLMKGSFWERIYYKNQAWLRRLIAPILFGQHATIVDFLVRYYCRDRKKVLDLGARRSPYTASLQGLVVGIDLPSEFNATLGFSLPSLGQFIQEHRLAVFGNGEHLPFKPGTFDVVLMIEVIEHIERDREALIEIHNVLKPGGILIVTTPNGETFPVPSKYHVRHYTPSNLKTLITTFFKIEHFWCLFPKCKLWRESIRPVNNLVQEKKIISLMRHVLSVSIYWIYVIWRFVTNNENNTATLCLVAKKMTQVKN